LAEKQAVTPSFSSVDSFEKVGASTAKARSGATILFSTEALIRKLGKDVNLETFFSELVTECFKERQKWFSASSLDSQFPVVEIKTSSNGITLETAVKNMPDFTATPAEINFYADYGPVDDKRFEGISTNILDSSLFIALNDLGIPFSSEGYGDAENGLRSKQ
jgi:hypothetical protein